MSKPLISQTYQSIFLAIEKYDWQRTLIRQRSRAAWKRYDLRITYLSLTSLYFKLRPFKPTTNENESAKRVQRDLIGVDERSVLWGGSLQGRSVSVLRALLGTRRLLP
jgi:hypothetical protein